MTAEIIEFPMRRHEDRAAYAVIGLEEIVREVERIAVEQPADGLDRQLTRIQTAFTSLREKIAATREALGELGKPEDR